MKTGKIIELASFSDTYKDNATDANRVMSEVDRCSFIKIHSPCYILSLDLDLYPELKPLVEKICKYIVKCESKKQKDVILEMLHAMEES